MVVGAQGKAHDPVQDSAQDPAQDLIGDPAHEPKILIGISLKTLLYCRVKAVQLQINWCPSLECPLFENV